MAGELEKDMVRAMTQGGNRREFKCDKHGAYSGTVIELNGLEREPMCPVCMLVDEPRQAAKRYAREYETQQKHSLSKLLGHSGIPPRFIQRGFDTYQVSNQEQAAALELAREYATNFSEKRKMGEGLLFIGSTGTGKTHLATAICKAVIRSGYQAYFTSVLSVMQVIKESYRRDSELSEGEAIAKFVEVDLLAMDEIGVQHNSDTERMFLTEIINQRYEQMKPTILLSNLPPKAERGEDLMKVLGPRIVSRLKEVNTTVVCDWEDYRAA
jgi:DNA replication protein DnaC